MSTIPISQQAVTRHPSHVLVANILQMILRNGIAGSLNRPRPCTIEMCNSMRAQLLQDIFFDPEHLPHELGTRMRPSKVLYSDLVVLMARLMRVFMQQEPLTEAQKAERVEVRRLALEQPFFDREKAESRNPFSDPPVDDEACYV